MGQARDGEGGRVVNDGWRDVRPDEVFEPGRQFRMNQTDGTTQVYDPQPELATSTEVTWSARGRDGEPNVALTDSQPELATGTEVTWGPGARQFWINQTELATGIEVTWGARGRDGEPIVALTNLLPAWWAEIDGKKVPPRHPIWQTRIQGLVENYVSLPHMLPWWGEVQTAMIRVTVYAPESAMGVYDVTLTRTVTASAELARQVTGSKVIWSAQGRDGELEPIVARRETMLNGFWADDKRAAAIAASVAEDVAEDYFGSPHMLPWWGDVPLAKSIALPLLDSNGSEIVAGRSMNDQVAMIRVTIHAPEPVIGVYNVTLLRSVRASAKPHV
jgi:hypothetical protein